MSQVDSIIDTIDAVAPVAPPNTYYDSARKEYLFPRSNGSWLRLAMSQAKRHLKALGFDSRAVSGQTVSPLDAALNHLELVCAVDYTGSLAGHQAGYYEMCGHKILVTESPELVHPSEGSWQHIRNLFVSLFGSDGDQYMIFMGWLKIAIEALYEGKPRPGQAIALCGPKNCGKSLLQNLLTLLIGGRVAKPFQYAFGLTQFNADLFSCEHLAIEDEQPSTHMNIRRAFGTFLKGVAANEVHRLHAKNRDAIALQPHWRVSISVNDEPENLMVLPPLDDSLIDKLSIFLCSPPSTPFNDGSPAGRRQYWERLVADVPCLIHHLLQWEIPIDLRCERYGIRAYQHPELVESLLELSSERRLLSLIDMADIFPDGESWKGPAESIERMLRIVPATQREADRLFAWRGAASVYLGRLSRSNPDRVTRAPREHGGQRGWIINPPAHHAAREGGVPHNQAKHNYDVFLN
jgi:hypothetical protein